MSVATIVRSWIGEVYYIASCVRTPLGRMNGALKELTDARLGAIVINSVLQRSAIDKTEVDHVLIQSDKNALPEMLSHVGLQESVKYSTVIGLGGLKGIVSSIDLIERGMNVIMCERSTRNYSKNVEILSKYGSSDMENEQQYIHNNLKNIDKAKTSGEFLEVIEPIRIPGNPRLKRNPVNLIEDETLEIKSVESNSNMAGAAACILTSKNFINNVHFSPTCKVLSFVETTSNDLSALSLLEANKLSTSDISLWQINDDNFDHYHRTVKKLGIDEGRVNIHGGSSLLGHSGLLDLIHLSNSLRACQKGIVLHGTQESNISILIEKPPLKPNFISPEKKPILNLFTKDPCPLCDELKMELASFLDRVQLEEIFLTPESYWYKLYRYEIPVLFLGGRYVCRNKLDIRVFEITLRKLEMEIR